jgi:trans-aconitate methyltransferase
VDLGCGTGAAGAAWAVTAGAPSVLGIDRHPWALAEAARTYAAFSLRGRVSRADAARAAFGPAPAGIVAAFAANELDADRRRLLRARLLEESRRGSPVLVVEPIARGIAPWWDEWRAAFEATGGRADEWRLPIERPPIIERLDRASGLDHRVLTARSLWVAPAGRE